MVNKLTLQLGAREWKNRCFFCSADSIGVSCIFLEGGQRWAIYSSSQFASGQCKRLNIVWVNKQSNVVNKCHLTLCKWWNSFSIGKCQHLNINIYISFSYIHFMTFIFPSIQTEAFELMHSISIRSVEMHSGPANRLIYANAMTKSYDYYLFLYLKKVKRLLKRMLSSDLNRKYYKYAKAQREVSWIVHLHCLAREHAIAKEKMHPEASSTWN